MSIKDTSVLCNIIDKINKHSDIEALLIELKSIFSTKYDISEINLLYYDTKIKKLKDASKGFEPVQDYYSEEKSELLNCIFEKLNNVDFVINDDTELDDLSESDIIITKTLSLGLKDKGNTIGFIRLKFRTKEDLKFQDFKQFLILSYNLGLKLVNTVLQNKLEITSSFYKSMKDIAKITETQYDFQYIIPIIGEMLDKFLINHLIYIFVKKDDKYTLYWPGACWNKKVYELMDTLGISDGFKLSDDYKTGVFPLVSENEITGCVVAHSTTDRLTDEEIGYITELSNQSAITLERANAYSEMLENATTDALTGLNNRRQFEIRLKEQYAAANRQNTPFCAIMTDIDYFKKFNDMYGHSTGDLVLKTVAGVIKSQLREYDIPSRYGGEEFCILLPQTNLEEAKTVAERLRSSVEHTEIPVQGENNVLKITISVGLAQLDIKDMPEDLYMKADRALYTAKENGRNRIEIYK